MNKRTIINTDKEKRTYWKRQGKKLAKSSWIKLLGCLCKKSMTFCLASKGSIETKYFDFIILFYFYGRSWFKQIFSYIFQNLYELEWDLDYHELRFILCLYFYPAMCSIKHAKCSVVLQFNVPYGLPRMVGKEITISFKQLLRLFIVDYLLR